jgi:hypothetical protein
MLFSGSTAQNPHLQSGEVVVTPGQYGLENLGGILNFSLSPNGQWLFLTGASVLGSGSYEYIYIM